jgi:hypothetical protein
MKVPVERIELATLAYTPSGTFPSIIRYAGADVKGEGAEAEYTGEVAR